MKNPLILFAVRCLLKLIVVAASPFAKVRFGLILHRSVGRISGNVEYYFRKRERDKDGEIHILVAGTDPVNKQLMTMIRRKAKATKGTYLIECDFLWNLFREAQGGRPAQPGRQGTDIDLSIWVNLRHAGYLIEWETWEEMGPQLQFTAEEETKGQALLKTLGLPEGAEFVVIHARDKAYTDSPDSIRLIDDYFTYNDFRDCDIQSYMPAAEWLTEQGIWVIRVGHVVEGPIQNDNPMIVDYAGRFRRHIEDPDFADVFLQAKCKFFLGCTAGIYYYSHMFDVPMAFVHMAPLAETGRVEHDLFILKRYWHSGKNRFLTFKEMVDRGADYNRIWHDTLRRYEEEGIEITDNAPEDLLELTKEMYARLAGTWKPEPGDAELQQGFRDAFPEGHPMRDFRGYMGADYTRKNKELLLP